MNTYSIYSLDTGIFTGVSILGSDDHIKMNTPDGHCCLIGKYDHLSQRVDLLTGKVVDYQPPQPSTNHQWNEIKKRWEYVKTDADIAAEVRKLRDNLIAASDWLVTRQQETGQAIPEEWKAYRKSLRDITSQEGFPRDINWPIKPV